MTLEDRIHSFSELGRTLRAALTSNDPGYSGPLKKLIDNQQLHNPWFTPENVSTSLNAIASELTEEILDIWLKAYPHIKESFNPVRVGVIMAGNIPVVGFHDFLSVLITGNNIIAKTSSKDSELIRYISEILCTINPEFRSRIEFTESTLAGFDAVIATGSTNTSRYFEYYFGKYPSIIRKNRNSIAIISGEETDRELEALGSDIFSYFGLGCRNVSKLYLPAGYDISGLYKHWGTFSDCIRHPKYANNYDFNKAVFMVNKEFFIDTGYLLLKEDSKLSSPVSVLHYEFYNSEDALKQQIVINEKNIQCVVGRGYISFGKAQWPSLWDYADGIDTIEFLLKKNLAGIL